MLLILFKLITNIGISILTGASSLLEVLWWVLSELLHRMLFDTRSSLPDFKPRWPPAGWQRGRMNTRGTTSTHGMARISASCI